MYFEKHRLGGRVFIAGIIGLAGALAANARPLLFRLSSYTSIRESDLGKIGSPAISPDGSRVAFIHCYDPFGTNPAASPQLFIASTDGSTLTQATASGSLTEPRAPVFSHDGAFVFFTARLLNPTRREVFRVQADGSNLRRLTFQDPATKLDPIERVVPISDRGAAFATAADLLNENLDLENDERHIYRVDEAGVIQRITDQAAHPLREAQVLGGTADGSMLAYSVNDRSLPGARPYRPLAIGLDTPGLVPLTPDLGSTFIEGRVAGTTGHLVFASTADYVGLNSGRRPQIFRVDSNGAGIEQITQVQFSGAENPGTDATGARFTFESTSSILINETTGRSRVYTQLGADLRRASTGWQGALSANGLRVAYVDSTDSLGLNGDGTPEIFTVRPDGGDRRQHSRYVGGISEGPDLSSDGRWVAFTSTADLDGGNADGNAEIYLAQADGTGLIRLTDSTGGRKCREPSISASGSFVAFSSNADLVPGENEDGNFEIFRISADGTAIVQITDSDIGDNRAPVTSAGGDTIAFISTADIVLGANMGSGRVAVWSRGAIDLVTPTSDRAIEKLFMSDDGTRLALLTTANLGGRNPNHFRLPHTVTTSGDLLRALNLEFVRDDGLGLSPDGGWLAIAHLDGVLAVIPYSGGTADTALADPNVIASRPALSEAGSFLAYTVLVSASGNQRGDTFRLDRSTGAVLPVIGAAQSTSSHRPSLSADGNRVAFVLSGVDSLNPDGSTEVFTASFSTTAVRLESFDAWLETPDVVKIRWRAAADHLHAYFLVERAAGAGGPWQSISEPVAGPGPDYEIVDLFTSEDVQWYRLSAIDRAGRSETFGPVSVRRAAAPAHRLRVQADASGGAKVSYWTSAPERVSLRVFDLQGRKVKALFEGMSPGGWSTLSWDGRNEQGRRAPSGMYYVRLNEGPSRSVVLVR